MIPARILAASVTFSCLALLLNACMGGSGEHLDENGQRIQAGGQGTETGDNTSDNTGAGTDRDLFTRIQNDILTPDCATSGCHTGTTAPLGLNLSAGKAYTALINEDSRQVSGLMLVEPSNADASYLVHKLEGTQGGGAQMPMGKSALNATELALVREWIQAGAPDAQVNTSDTGNGDNSDGDDDSTGGDDANGHGDSSGGGDDTSDGGDGGDSVNPGDAGSASNKAATLAAIQNDVFDVHCSGCHGGTRPSSDLDLNAGNSFTQLVGRYAAMGTDGQQLVVPGDAANSFLIDKLRGENLGVSGEKGRRMPLYSEPLDEATLQQIENWIDTGAEDN